MPLDTKSRTTTKPLTPALSSNLRARPTHGLTPRLATATPTSPASAPQRSLRQQTLSPDRPDEARASSLNSNVTPRSGARVSRFDTESPSTPDTAARGKAVKAGDPLGEKNENYGLGVLSPATPTYIRRQKSTDQISLLPTANGRRISSASTASPAKDESKFIRANDAKTSSASSTISSSRPKAAQNARAPSPRVSPRKTLGNGYEKSIERPFHTSSAVHQSDARAHKPILVQKLSYASSTVASTASLPRRSQTPTRSICASPSELASKTQQVQPGPPIRQRALSNAQSALTSTIDRRRSSSLNINTESRSRRNSPSPSPANNSPVTASRPDGTRQKLSIQVVDTGIELPVQAHSATAAISPSSSSPRSTSLASTNTAATSLTSETTRLECQPSKRAHVQLRHTRGSSETTALQPITKDQLDAANNARRERKALDLEISNSSLLAINKTLEKELRKQNGELRRFRRLSRSGRLSFTPSHRIVSGASMSTLATLEETDHDGTLIPRSPNSSDGGSLDEDDSYISDDGSSSFTESSEKMHRRARDEKKLMQDLRRHQEILLDSQKLTQSIQRCLNRTDELIKDGNKALAYQVVETEVQLGGRVLAHEDDEALSEVDLDQYKASMGKSELRQGLLSPSISRTELEEAAMWINGLQSLDGQNETVRGIGRMLPERTTTESSLATLD